MTTKRSTQPSVIRVEDGGGFHTTTNGMMAAVLLGAIGLFIWYFRLPWNFDFNSPEFNPMILVPVFLGVFGLYYLALTVQGTLRARKFGRSVLEIQGSTVRMGQRITGVVKTSVELSPRSDYEMCIQCIETFETRGSSSGSTKNVDRVRWEDSTRVASASVSSRSGIPFEFTLPEPFEKTPAAAPGSSSVLASALVSINIPGMKKVFAHNQAPSATRWVLEVKAPLEGVDYYAIFGIIVEQSTRDRGAVVEVSLNS